jgi:nucleoside-diphosphate-sugar epimerase
MYSSQKQHPMITLNSQINPSSKYGETKAESWKLIKLYRAQFGVKSYGLILFNHTSSRSKPNFLFPELASQFSNILDGKSGVIKIRDTEAFIDIFSAEELGEGLIRCINSEFTQDLIFSSGNYVKISDVIHDTAETLGMKDNIELISTHPTNRLIPLYGDISNTFEILKWLPVSTPSEILAKMVKMVRNVD